MPFTAYAWPCRSDPPAVATPAVSGATPVCSRPSCVKFRPLSGRSTISRPVTTLPSVLLDESTSGASTLTVTVSFTDATSSWRSSRDGLADVHLNGWRTSVPNCGASTVRPVAAHRQQQHRYRPSEDVVDILREAGVEIQRDDVAAGHDGGGLVGDDPLDGSRRILCERREADAETQLHPQQLISASCLQFSDVSISVRLSWRRARGTP